MITSPLHHLSIKSIEENTNKLERATHHIQSATNIGQYLLFIYYLFLQQSDGITLNKKFKLQPEAKSHLNSRESNNIRDIGNN